MSSVLITRRLPGASVARLAAHHEVDLHAGELPLSAEELHERLEGKAGVVVLLGGRIDRAAIDAAGPSLKVIANVAVGYDNLDVAYAVSKGIVCTNTPDVLTDATADLTWALILGITRRLGEGERHVASGRVEGLGLRLHARRQPCRQAAGHRRRRAHRTVPWPPARQPSGCASP